MAKVCKSDGQGTFAGTQGNGELAPVPAVHGPESNRGEFDAEQPFALMSGMTPDDILAESRHERDEGCLEQERV
jgi:hypothetical protein